MFTGVGVCMCLTLSHYFHCDAHTQTHSITARDELIKSPLTSCWLPSQTITIHATHSHSHKRVIDNKKNNNNTKRTAIYCSVNFCENPTTTTNLKSQEQKLFLDWSEIKESRRRRRRTRGKSTNSERQKYENKTRKSK